jgi:hypothetical protein
MSTKPQPIVSPRGIAVWPRLNEPDFKFNENGEFSVDLRVDPNDPTVAGFLAELEQIYEEHYEATCQREGKKKLKRADMPWKPETDEDDDETGMVLIRFKRRHKVTSKKTGKTYFFQPVLFDSQRNPTTEMVGGGSEVRVKCEPYGWYTPQLGCGLKLSLSAVQIIELVSPGGANADGFDDEEGYVAAAATDEFPAEGEGDAPQKGDY